MKKITFLLLMLSSLFATGQTFYDLNTIQTIQITFAESNWDALMDANEASAADPYLSAQSVTINGVTYNTVGVKYKGNSSFNANQVKNPLHIELDTYVDQNYQGYTDIKLSNVIFDPTFVREALGYKILANYMDVPLANYAKVYINGSYIGLYSNVESISKKFVDGRFGSKTNAFFDCSPPAGAGPTSTNLPNLAYLGTNSASYTTAYEMKSDVAGTGWADLIALTNTLSTTTTANTANIEAVLDIDRTMWFLAYHNLFVNLDSYIGQFKQNYYLYKSDNGQFNPIIWDLNMCFGVFGSTGSGSTLTTATKKTLSHTTHLTETAWPLVNKLLAIPTYKKRYLAHYKTMLAEVVSTSGSNYFLTDAQAMQTLISAAVASDVNKFSYQTTANMSGNLNSTDVTITGGGNNTAPGISGLMSARNTYLSALSDFTNTQPTISNIVLANTAPAVGTSVNVTTTVTNTNYVYLGYRTNKFEKFTKIQMFDDGAHNDGASGDGVYGASMPITSISTQYYFYAENTNVGRFSPARAEHEFYTVTGTYPTLTTGTLVVNELMAQNTNTVTDDAGEYEDWFELYNNSSNTISLDNLYASDSQTNLLKWAFPSGITMAPHSYLIVWADQDLTQTGIHANFKFSVGGENCILSYPNGVVVDNVVFGIQTSDMGYARIPNGTGNFVIQAPTFNANNESALSVNQVNNFNSSLKLYPNPTSNILNISNEEYVIESIEVINLQGQILFKSNNLNQNNMTIDLSNYSNGMYLVNINNQTSIKIIKK
jgi:spore coat protein CotH